MKQNEEFDIANVDEAITGSQRIRNLGAAAVVLGAGILIGDEIAYNLLSSPLAELAGSTLALAGLVTVFHESTWIRKLRNLSVARQQIESKV